ncbi:hypothetical protein N7488_012421 [Penicillium malachiteum]|nr:hypothetical protein N7488_012421 [Penicillium malachiteum]
MDYSRAGSSRDVGGGGDQLPGRLISMSVPSCEMRPPSMIKDFVKPHENTLAAQPIALTRIKPSAYEIRSSHLYHQTKALDDSKPTLSCSNRHHENIHCQITLPAFTPTTTH